jgi:hypothetical protein
MPLEHSTRVTHTQIDSLHFSGGVRQRQVRVLRRPRRQRLQPADVRPVQIRHALHVHQDPKFSGKSSTKVLTT